MKSILPPPIPDVTLLGPGPLTSWEMDPEDEKNFWDYCKRTFGFASYKEAEGIVHRDAGIRADGTSGAAGLFHETVLLLKEVIGVPASTKIIYMEGGHNAANNGHANLFATEPEVPVVAVCNGGFSGDVWGKDLKEQYEAKGHLKKVILVNVPDGESANAQQVQQALRAAGVQEGAPFNITFTSSETSTGVMIPKQNMVDILNIPGRKRALVDASSGLMAQELVGIDGTGRDGVTRGVSFFATGQKALRLPTDYCMFALCREDEDVLEKKAQARATIPMPKAIRIEPGELDAEVLKRSSRVIGCLEVFYGLAQMRLMQNRGINHIEEAKRTSGYVKAAAAKHPAFDFFVKNPENRSTYNMVLVSKNAELNKLSPPNRAAVMVEAHHILADEKRARNVKPYGNRGDFRFTTLDIKSEEQAKITIDNFAYAVARGLQIMKNKTIDLVAEDQFLYSTPQEVEAAITAKKQELAKKGIQFIDGRKRDVNYYRLPEGRYVIYKPDLLVGQITAEYKKIQEATVNNSIIVAAKTIPPEARFSIFVREGAGVNNIPKAAAAKDGHVVVNCPGVNSKVTANNTLNAIAGHPHITNFVAKGMSGEATALNLQPLYGRSPEVDKERLNSGVSGKVTAVLGAGNIGTQVIKELFNSSAAKVKIYSPSLAEKDWNAQLRLLPDNIRNKLVICKTLDEAFRGTDIVANHVPLNDKTKHLIGKAQLDLLNPGAVIADAARAGIFKSDDLIAAHQSGHISRVVVDFDTPDKAKDEDTAKLFAYAKTAQAQGFEFSPHAFADTCPATRANMLDTALLQVSEIRQGKVHNYAGAPEGKLPPEYQDAGTRTPKGIMKFEAFLHETIREANQTRVMSKL
jgi:phosphoglycerate dehydrogenase-like enzyme/aspartate aminotransferase-like enzyme